MTIIGYSSLGAAARNGQVHTAHIRKVPSQASTAGHWVDLSMAAGQPQPNYYASAPLEAATLNPLRGIFAGDDVSPLRKYLAEIALVPTSGNAAGRYELLDYLLYYPFVDLDDASEQLMDNTTAQLTRYEDGAGVRAMLVITAPTVGSGTFTYRYVNQDGIERTSPTIACNTTAANIATIGTSQQAVASAGGVLLPLASGDTGIRSIVAHQQLVLNGGLASLVLVKPIASIAVSEINVPAERSFLSEGKCPEVLPGAFLGFVMNCAGTVAGVGIVGRVSFVWA